MRHPRHWILVCLCVVATGVAHAQDTQADQDEAPGAGLRAADKAKGVDSDGNKLGQPEKPAPAPPSRVTPATAAQKRAALRSASTQQTARPPRRGTKPVMTRHYQAEIKNNGTVRRVLATNNPVLIKRMLEIMKTHPASFLEQTEELKQLEIMAKEDEHGRQLYHDTTALYPDFDDEMEELAARDVWPEFQMGDDKTNLPELRPGGQLEASICADPALCAHGSANGPVAGFEPIRIHLGFGFGARGRPEPVAPLIHTQPPPEGGLVRGQLSEFAQLFQFIGPLLAAVLGGNRGGRGRGGGYPVPFGPGFGGNLGMRPGGYPGGFGGRGGFAPPVAGRAFGGAGGAPGSIPIYQPPPFGGGSIYNSNSVYGNVQNGGVLGLQGQLGNPQIMAGLYPPAVAGRAL